MESGVLSVLSPIVCHGKRGQKMTDIHNRKTREKRTLQKIKSSPKISDNNKTVIQDFIKQVKAENASKDRIHNYLWALHKVCKHTDIDLEHADKDDLIEVVGAINNNELGVRDYAPLSKEEFRKTLSKLYRAYFDKPDLIDFMQIGVKKKNQKNLKSEEIPSPDDVKEMVDACRNSRDEALVMTLWDTGGRIEETLNLRWKDLDIKRTSDTRQTFELRFEESKTQPRKIPIADCVPSLRKWMDEHPSPEGDSYIFTKYEGNLDTKHAGSEPVQYSTAHAALERIRERVDIDERVNTNPHAFRKARATFFAAAGMQGNGLKQHFGWSDIQTTEKYIQLGRNQLDSAYKEAVGIEEDETEDLDKDKLKPGKCRSCGWMVSAAWSYCHNCGDTIEGDNLLSMLESDERSDKEKEIRDIEKRIERLKNS